MFWGPSIILRSSWILTMCRSRRLLIPSFAKIHMGYLSLNWPVGYLSAFISQPSNNFISGSKRCFTPIASVWGIAASE